jgi:small subunit ribosomal protein S9
MNVVHKIHAIGRRKTSVARIYMNQGTGIFTVNEKKVENYFPVGLYRSKIEAPFLELDLIGKYDVLIKVKGGGLNGQLEAIRLAESRALSILYPDKKTILKKSGFLKRDPRKVERKKFGRKKSRKKFMFTKR